MTQKEQYDCVLATAFGPIQYSLKLSRRRHTILIQINEAVFDSSDFSLVSHPTTRPPGATVSVMAPYRAPQEVIRSFIRQKAKWIVTKTAEIEERQRLTPRKIFAPGEEFLFLGKKYPLQISRSSENFALTFNDNGWIVNVEESLSLPEAQKKIAEKFVDWYREQAQEILGSRVFHYSRRMGVEPLEIALRRQKTLWGSCHIRRRSILLNWQIVMAPLSVVDYVVVHELSHLKVSNHSCRFWKTVEAVLPNYDQERRWLKENRREMLLPSYSIF